MAAYDVYSHSPQVSDLASPQHRGSGPITPIHSPHHSVHSSASLRTPLQTLSIHEYRKQQSTPHPRIATPSGKTLRRKASAFALNEIERVPSTKPTLQYGPHSFARPLQPSHSAHQLAPQDQIFGVQPVSDHVFRSQSAEPRTQGGSISSVATVDSQGKVRNFGNRKRLPRPPAPTGSALFFPSHAPVRPTRQIRATLPAPLSFLAEETNLSDAQTTPPTPSLSRFPQPPRFVTLRETEREKAISFASTAPVTPPATPATIHYRGASFNLVNPHDSLQFHDIVTPSRDLESSEVFPLRSAQSSHVLTNAQMAPKRPLYGDLNAAHAGIMRRAEDSFDSSMLELPLPPTPAAISPGSSTYTSPIYSPESHFAPSPLAVKKAPNESRFSLRQLTRTLTKRLTRPQETGEEEEELQQFKAQNTCGLSTSVDETPLRPLEQTYMPADRMPYFPISPVSPTSPASPASLHDLGSVSGDDEDEIEFARRDPVRGYDSQGLTSMLPDEHSTQTGRAGNSRTSVFATESAGRPYYDDRASTYASSSIYTGDDHRKSACQQSLAGNRQSNVFLRYSGMDAAGMANEYSYSNLGGGSRPVSRPLTKQSFRRSVAQGDGNSDTISKFIDQYEPGNTATNSFATQPRDSGNTISLLVHYTSDVDEAPLNDRQFEFGLKPTNQAHDIETASSIVQKSLPQDYIRNRRPGLPPSGPAPLAPAFQYDQQPCPLARPEASDMFSNASYTSYGDTRNLLQLPQPEAGGRSMLMHSLEPSSSYSEPENKGLEPSSSYSQPEGCASPQTPQEALDQAEHIFDKAAAERDPSQEDIPAMWGRWSSVNLLRNKRLTDGSLRTIDAAKADWETVAGDSEPGRMSLDSIAGYSSSEGGRNSYDRPANASIPTWTPQNHTRGQSNYSHPSPLPIHMHPFSSSPPHITTCPGSQTAPDMSASGPASSSPASSTEPVFLLSTEPRYAVLEPYAFAPWADPYALSDKETQELLASGPNDDILVDSDVDQRSEHLSYRFKSHERTPQTSSPRSNNFPCLERENTFDKFTVVGPKGNLTGTPQGTGMHDAGSSVADTSSPGAKLSSSPRAEYDGFYASPFPATGSVTRIRQTRPASEDQHERTPSQVTLFPSAYSMEPVQGSSPLAGPDRRRSLRYSTQFKPARRASRTAVPGQTKLRQMVLAPDARSTVSSKDTYFSRFVNAGGSGRPSTCDMATPLHPTHPSLDTFPTIRSGKTTVAHQHSPHLLCPEREVKEEDEIRRRKLSWLIFACFCILPPCMFLHRMWGDSIMASVTNGDLGHCTAKSKRAALIAGIVVNIGLISAILVPILVAQALKAI
ncbi:uncharacterized protein M421DRAFT_76745 [Didymella exigua CBS 183.55]|uniref:Uncharacterized protein n=1 Tax=Didymella exigua CBS 183.55 TaxID=1150837 RepID=A0A6A5R7E1_9PLEO|nr:uncharacterized protein M421DRAFT_76745 [Didymella exigua CBS 183.55]KAF1922884.1 hypothetical protein M421DRAFT_76745 [Didymella exigua CBS 183.55]